MTAQTRRNSKVVAKAEAEAKAKTEAVIDGDENLEPRPIRVLNAYIGTPSGERWILPGDYLEDDPKIFGLGEYLVETIHDAVWV